METIVGIHYGQKLKRQIEIISIKGNSKYKLIKYEGKTML